MKKYYEIALMQQVKGSVEDDYETVLFNEDPENYHKAKSIAKMWSMHIGQPNVRGFEFCETETLNEGLACVKIICYCHTEETEYERIWSEEWRNGKKVSRHKYQRM